MKKVLTVLLAFGLVVSLSGTAFALSFTDTTIFTADGTVQPEDYDSHGWGDVNKLESIGDYVQWTHYFDFDPPADEVLSGTLTLSFRDDGGLWDFFEFGFGWTEDGAWNFGEINTGSYDYDVQANSLLDGTFQVTVASLGGDFYIDQSDLEIEYNPVPEPGTMLLLGSGLVGLAGWRRKSKK